MFSGSREELVRNLELCLKIARIDNFLCILEAMKFLLIRLQHEKV